MQALRGGIGALVLFASLAIAGAAQAQEVGQADLAEWVDALAIERVITRLIRARDTGDSEVYRELLAEDAEFRIPDGTIMRSGRDNIVNAVAANARRFNPENTEEAVTFGIMRHLVTNLDVSVDGNNAAAEYYVLTLANHPVEGNPELVSFARNQDTFVRAQDGWRLQSQTIFYDWGNDDMARLLQIGPYSPPPAE